MKYTYKTKSIEERIWLIDMAYERGLIPEQSLHEVCVDIDTEEDWGNYPYVVYYNGIVDLRCMSETEVSLDELLELTNMIPKSGLIVKHIKKHVL
jgi:hypothetical protein